MSYFRIEEYIIFHNAKEYKTQTLKDTEINLKKNTLHGSYNMYKKSKKIRIKINRTRTYTHTKRK